MLYVTQRGIVHAQFLKSLVTWEAQKLIPSMNE